MLTEIKSSPHGAGVPPSPWVCRFLGLTAPGGSVLDLAAGGGRHAAHAAAAGFRVTAVDRDPAAVSALEAIAGVEVVQADLEGGPWPLAGRVFDAIVVTNYLWRPLFPLIFASLEAGAVLIYETFAAGNEMHGRPSNPAFLLRPGELLEISREYGLAVVAYEYGLRPHPQPAVIQRLCARRGTQAPALLEAAVAPRG